MRVKFITHKLFYIDLYTLKVENCDFKSWFQLLSRCVLNYVKQFVGNKQYLINNTDQEQSLYLSFVHLLTVLFTNVEKGV